MSALHEAAAAARAAAEEIEAALDRGEAERALEWLPIRRERRQRLAAAAREADREAARAALEEDAALQAQLHERALASQGRTGEALAELQRLRGAVRSLGGGDDTPRFVSRRA